MLIYEMNGKQVAKADIVSNFAHFGDSNNEVSIIENRGTFKGNGEALKKWYFAKSN